MDGRFKQRPKKRRTRRSLDQIRKRSTEMKNIVNPNNNNQLNYKNIPNYYNQITSKRLTLAKFKKTITSKTVTRGPQSRSDSVDIDNEICIENILSAKCNKSQNILGIGSNNDIKICELGKTKRLIEENNSPQSVNLFSPLHHEDIEDSANEVSSKETNYWHTLSDTSQSSLETESNYSLYEKFMKELSGYIRKHFPSLTGADNVKRNLFDALYREDENDNSKCLNNKISGSLSKIQKENIIPNPLDYVQTGSSGSPKVQKKQDVSASSTSTSVLSQFKSNCLFLNSPEYQYFPHKLNE